jgi:hypothetical protein
MDVGGHPRWPQIVLACPAGINPAARPIPPDGEVVEDLAANEMASEAGSGFRVDPDRSRQVPARTAAIPED